MFQHVCADDNILSFRIATMTAQDVREHMLGIGSCWFMPLVILCTAFGVWWPGLPPAASSSAFRLDKLTAWWHRGPQVAILSLPDMLKRVRRHPYGRFCLLHMFVVLFLF